MTFGNKYHSLSSRYANNYSPHRLQPTPAAFTRKRPYSPPRPPSPAYPYMSPSRNPSSARRRRRDIDSPHSSSQSSYDPSIRPQKRHRRAPLSTIAPKNLYDGTSVSQSTVIHCASFSQGALGCISTAVERKLGVRGLAQEGVAHLWDVRGNPPSLRLRSTLHHQSRVFRAALCSDSLTAVTTSQDGIARVWSAVGNEYTADRLSFYQPFRNARACALSPDAKYVAVSFYSGSKKPTYEGGDCISSFKSQVFVRQLQTDSIVFEQVEKGIADQIVLAENASIIAIGLCGVTPAPKIARRHRILLYNKRGTLLLSLHDCFPPEQHSCTAWHMSMTGDRLALCSKSNQLQVYLGGNRREWDRTPTVLSSQSFHSFRQCRFARNPDILAAVGISGKSGESVLGLFRVSDGTALFVVPMQVPIANVLDIHPYTSQSHAMDAKNTAHSVSVVSAVSGKASRPGSLLNLHVYSDPRETKGAQRFSKPESKSRKAEQRAPEKMAVDNSRNTHFVNTGFVPFRLCRDPSPLRQVHLESPSASRSSAALKSSESSVQTPLHNRFASWSFDRTAKQTLTSCETESQNLRRGEKHQYVGEKISNVPDPVEGALKNCDPSPEEKGVSCPESCISPKADTAQLLKNHKNTKARDASVPTTTRESSTKSKGLVNSNEPVSSIEPGSLSNSKSYEAQLESHVKTKKSATPLSEHKLDSTNASTENDQNVIQEKQLIIDKDKNTWRRSETEEDKNGCEKKPSHTEEPLSMQNKAASETKKGCFKANQQDGSDICPDKEKLARQPAHQEELPKAPSKKNDMKNCPPKTLVPVPETNLKQDDACENNEVRVNTSVDPKDFGRGNRSKNGSAVIEKNAKKGGQAEKGSVTIQDARNHVNESCEKEKVESLSAISTPQSDDWTPATRFAAMEQIRMRDAKSTANTGENEHPTPQILKRGVTGSKDNQILKDVHKKQVSVENEDAKLVLQNEVGTETLSECTENLSRTPLNKGGSHRDLLTATKNIKTEMQPIMVNRSTTTPASGNERQGERARDDSKGGGGTADLIRAPTFITQEAEARGVLRASEQQKTQQILKEDRHLCAPNEISTKSIGVLNKECHTTPLTVQDKEAPAWPTVDAQLGPDENKIHMVEDEPDGQDTHVKVPSRYLERCRKVFSEACQAFQVADMNTLTNQDAYTIMLGFTEKELNYVEKKSVAKIIYDIVGIRNACSLPMFIDAFGQILETVRASRIEYWTGVFSRATCKAGESILVFHARDLLKGERDQGNISLGQKWTDTELEALFERISDGMLVDLASFLHCVDEVLDS
ncbi:WD40/YVTN repeat-like containing protein [Gracilaria domingensis]|nr:WD40/YVTN repeat-like containing protein [Gracilaria domingensis]